MLLSLWLRVDAVITPLYLPNCCEFKVGRAEGVAQWVNACLGSGSALPNQTAEQQTAVLDLRVHMLASLLAEFTKTFQDCCRGRRLGFSKALWVHLVLVTKNILLSYDGS